MIKEFVKKILWKLLGKNREENSSFQPRRQYSRSSINPAPTGSVPTVVQRDTRPYWDQRGWKKRGTGYVGYYRTPFGSVKGKATKSPSGRVKLYINKPPDGLRRHPHAACFIPRGGGWLWIHTHHAIKDLSSGILQVETVLKEAYQL